MDSNRLDDAPGSVSYTPVATFEYAVDGETYRGTNLESVSSTTDREAAVEALATTWAVGQALSIVVDPADPFAHTVEGDSTSRVWRQQGWLLLVAAACLGGAVWLWSVG